VGEPVRVSRVSDQDRDFLQFVERHDLKPGAIVRVEERDPAADSVRLRGAREFTIGTRAASKVLVQVAGALILLLTLGRAANAQPPSNGAQTPAPFAITDNSFLVEEAFNQEPGIFQNIFGVHIVDGGEWEAAFTQEWPLRTQTHQLSFTFSSLAVNGAAGLGDMMINYRWQASTEEGARPAFSPRLSLILPTGNASEGRGSGGPGWQVNLPFSRQFGDTYLHWNAGFTHTPAAQDDNGERNLFVPHAAVSGIWQLRPMLNLMLESILQWDQVFEVETRREVIFTLVPGIRTGWNAGDSQIVLGIGIPATFSDQPADVSVFGYLSYELPFRR
jgi:hypothetical protein